MNETQIPSIISPTSSHSGKMVASIISPTTVLLTVCKSRSTSAIYALQQEVQEVQQHMTNDSDRSMQRSQSLPSGLSARMQHGRQDEAMQRSLTMNHCFTAEARCPKMEEEIKESKLTVTTLEKTISHMKVHIHILEGQLKDEAQNGELLKEELEASRRLCCQLHEACSRGDVARSKPQSFHPAKQPVAVKHRFVQTLGVEQGTEFASCSPKEQLLKTGFQQGCAERDEDYQDKVQVLENEIVALQKKCKERDFQVRTITQQMSWYINQSSMLEAQQVTLRDNLRQAKNEYRSKEQQLIFAQTLLKKAKCELKELQNGQVSLARKCTEMKEQATHREAEVTTLKEALSNTKQKCRSLQRQTQHLTESLKSTEGEVTQKETALETKNTILEAIKTIAYTTPVPAVIPSKQRKNVLEVEERPSTDVGNKVGSGKATNHRHLISGIQGDYNVGEYRPRSFKNSSQSYGEDYSHCYGNDYEGLDYEESETYTSGSDSETDTSCQSKTALSIDSSKNHRVLCDQSNDRPDDAHDEEQFDCGDPEGEYITKYGVDAEGLLLRKQEQQNYALRSRDRSWHYVYVVQHGSLLWFYDTKDHKIRGKTIHDEPPVDLMDALVTAAVEYIRRKHVFRLQLTTGKQYIFQAKDDREMLYWVCCMDSAARCHNSLTNGVPSGSAVVPQTGSPSKSDRIKRIIKSSLSALTK